MEKLLLIDADSLLYYEAFKEQTLEEAINGVSNRLKIMLKANNTNKYAAFLTCSNNFRHNLAKTKKYKSSRTSTKPKLFYQLKDFTMNNLGFCIINNYEADDLVLYYADNIKEYNCIICSPDKDVIYQKDGIHFNYQFKKQDDENVKLGDFIEVSKEDVYYFKCKQLLTGDSVDSVIGIPKIGNKKADDILKNSKDEKLIVTVFKEYLKYFKDEHITVLKFYENVNLLQMINNDTLIEYFELPKLKPLPLIIKINNL